jgi:alkylated DNA repair dioxygenase AlkB
MDLFKNEIIENLLPADGVVSYHGRIFDAQQMQHYFDILGAEIEWKHDEAVMYGKRIITKRKVAWYGDQGFSYSYSGTTKFALPWTPALLELKKIAEDLTQTSFNSCLLNLYHDGSEGMTWHSDDEKALVHNSAIASMSFGVERKFAFKHKISKESVYVQLENGSLLVMKGATQTNWWHCLPKTTKISKPRINLTFRTMEDNTAKKK